MHSFYHRNQVVLNYQLPRLSHIRMKTDLTSISIHQHLNFPVQNGREGSYGNPFTHHCSILKQKSLLSVCRGTTMSYTCKPQSTEQNIKTNSDMNKSSISKLSEDIQCKVMSKCIALLQLENILIRIHDIIIFKIVKTFF